MKFYECIKIKEEKMIIFYIIMEYCNGKTLKKLIQKKGILKEFEAFKYLSEIINGIEVLGENNITHRDLKPENIFLHEGICKIGDLG